MGQILLFILDQKWAEPNFWIKFEIFKNSSVKKIMNQIYIKVYFVEIQTQKGCLQ